MIYVVVSCVGRLVLRDSRNVEVFPFFAWSLYSRVPGFKSDYGIRVVDDDGQREYLDYGRFGEFTTIGYKRVQMLGKSVSQGASEARIAEQRRIIESIYFDDDDIELSYELMTRQYDVLDRYTSGTFVSEAVLRGFTQIAAGNGKNDRTTLAGN